MSEFSNRADLNGWIPGNEAINSGAVAEEIARLAKENADLQLQIKNLSPSSARYNGLTFEEMYDFLNSYKLEISEDYRSLGEYEFDASAEVAKDLDEGQPTLLHYFWAFSRKFDHKEKEVRDAIKEANKLYEFGLLQETVEQRRSDMYSDRMHNVYLYILSDAGKQFLLRLRQDIRFKTANLEEHILPERRE